MSSPTASLHNTRYNNSNATKLTTSQPHTITIIEIAVDFNVVVIIIIKRRRRTLKYDDHGDDEANNHDDDDDDNGDDNEQK